MKTTIQARTDEQSLPSEAPQLVTIQTDTSKVIANARLTLKSPYLKAVYNGLKDLQEISDLLEMDELAKQRITPLFKEYWDKGPEKFTNFLLCMHDKGAFLTRSGERGLSLEPRLVPEWLGLVG